MQHSETPPARSKPHKKQQAGSHHLKRALLYNWAPACKCSAGDAVATSRRLWGLHSSPCEPCYKLIQCCIAVHAVQQTGSRYLGEPPAVRPVQCQAATLTSGRLPHPLPVQAWRGHPSPSCPL